MKTAVRWGLVLVAGAILAWYFLRPSADTPAGTTSGSVLMIDAGGHTCAVTADGAAHCWGLNEDGQLGNGGSDDEPHPAAVSASGSDIRAVSAGRGTTCSVSTAGAVRCWGLNTSGQVGDGTRRQRTRPVPVDTLASGVKGISVGHAHVCAVTASGAVRCWGNGSSGQLGDGRMTIRNRPVQVVGLDSGVTAVSAGTKHTCAVTDAGAVLCWGENGSGQLGDGTTEDRSRPVPVKRLRSGVVAVTAGGHHTCALTEAGGVLCWGDSKHGQLGNGQRADSRTPTEVSKLGSRVVAVSAGTSHSCAVDADGRVWCWGGNSPGGPLGDGTLETRLVPVEVPGVTGIATVSAGASHTCAVTTTGVAKCWGNNDHGQLGDGTTTNRLPGDVVFD